MNQYYIKDGEKWRKVKKSKCYEQERFGKIFLRYQIGQEIGMAASDRWKKEIS